VPTRASKHVFRCRWLVEPGDTVTEDQPVAEVDTTFEDGADVTDSEVPYGQAVSNDTLLLRNGTYWTHRVERVDGRTRLTFEELTAYPEPVEIVVRDRLPDDVRLSVTVSDENGTVVFERPDLTVASGAVGDRPRRIPVIDRFGTCDVELVIGDGRSAEVTWSVGWGPGPGRCSDLRVTITDEEPTVAPFCVEYARLTCPWKCRGLGC